VESEKKANTNIKTDMVLLAAAQTEETVTDGVGGYIQVAMGPSAVKIAGYLHVGEMATEFAEIALKAGGAGYEGLKYIAIEDCMHYMYSDIPYHSRQGYQNVDWKTIPGKTCEEKFYNYQKLK